MEHSYWNNNGKYQVEADKLRELVPHEGSVAEPRKNKWLEKFRNASNCYYDLYNNGLCNRMSQFSKVFGFPASQYSYKKPHFYDDRRYTSLEFLKDMYIRTEEVMDKIIYEAAVEQGFIK